MTILLLGKNGQLGRALLRQAPAKDMLHITAWGRAECDLNDLGQLRCKLDDLKPSIIINAAAYTDVDGAEKEIDRARLINTDVPHNLAQWAQAHGAYFVHVSTDYVFDGTKGAPYTEDDKPAPLNIYGLTKWNGEQAVMSSGAQHIIVRTSCLYDDHSNNFVTRLMQQIKRGDNSIPVVTDITGSPTAADDLAHTLWTIGAHAVGGSAPLTGLYHMAGAQAFSRYEWARQIIDQKNLAAELTPVTHMHKEGTAHRPRNTALSCEKFFREVGVKI